MNGDLVGEVWGLDARGHIRYLRVYIRQLRQKLESEPGRPRDILTEARMASPALR